MVLKNSLYKIVDKDTAVPAYRIALQTDHTIYQAHFPGEPVTPGVCIVQIAVELLGDLCGKTLALTAAKNMKFMSIISPVETPEVTYVFDKITPQDDHTVKAQVTVMSDDIPLTKLSLTCSEQGA